MSLRTPTAEFTKTIAAARAYVAAGHSKWQTLWSFGDALIAEVGPPGDDSANNGSEAKLNRASAELKRLDLPHSLIWLQKLRQCAHAFAPDNRLSGVSWTVHLAAGNRNNIDKIVEETKSKKLTVKYVSDWLKRQRPGPKRRLDVIAKQSLLTALRQLEALLPELPQQDIDGLIKESTNFVAACNREIASRAAPLREAAE